MAAGSTKASGCPRAAPPGPPLRVGIVGGGQLARMAAEAASALGIGVTVLAARADDSAVATAHHVLVGDASDEAALRELAARCDVVTFDHEQVDLDLLGSMEADGVRVRPGTATLTIAVDKARMRRRLGDAGLPVPRYQLLGTPSPARAADDIGTVAADWGWPVVVKAARGGYDGKGVWPVADRHEALAVAQQAHAAGVPLLVEELVAIDAELAVVVARRPGGETVAWPAVETAQVDGVCREVLYPGRLDPEVAGQATELSRRVADVVGAVGVLAVELFWANGRLLVNEVAARPHNSAHWTIEGSVTSQFENHLRAVLDLPLGVTTPTAPEVASVNVFGGPATGTLVDSRPVPPVDLLASALEVPGAHVHLYGKLARPGRKLGHVTVCGDDAVDVRRRAWTAAQALGTPVPPGVVLPPPATDRSATETTPRHSGRSERSERSERSR